MDFLRLFPSSSSPVSANHSQQLLFCAYKNLGLLCYSNGEPNKLHLVIVASALPTQKPQTAEEKPNSQPEKICVLFKRITSIVLSPKLPENALFTNLLVNASGSRVALVGTRMIFVVELDTDFWHRPPFDGQNCVDHLRPEYYAKCDLLHVGLFVRKFPPSVRCVRWYEPLSDFVDFFGTTKMPTLARLNSLLAVLFSDNVIRLYYVSTAVDCPFAQFDFNAVLPDRTPDDSEASGDEFGRAHSTLGFITQLVSFDFGPPQLMDGNQKVFGTLLALDSNGQLYGTLFPFDGIGPFPSPKGPLPLVGIPATSQQRLLCSALHLLHIRHPFGTQHFSLWAMASEDGLLTHFTLPRVSSIDNTLPSDGHANVVVPSSSFELFAIDCVDIGKSIASHQIRDPKASMVKTISRLQKIEFSDHCAYLVVGQRDVFRVELTALADHLWRQCSIGNAAKMTKKTLSEICSNVHQLLLFADSGECPSIGSVACVQTPMGTNVHDDDDATAANGGHIQCATKQPKRPQRQLLVAAECSFDTKMGRKSTFLATMANCFPPSLSSSSVAHQQQQQQPTMQNNGTPQHRGVVPSFNKKPLLADDVRAVLAAQHQAVSAAQPQQQEQQQQQQQLPLLLPAAVHFSDTNNDELGEELEQLQHRASQLSFVQQTIDQVLLQGQLPARSVAIDYALKRSTELLLALQAVEQFRKGATQRLALIFRQLNELKANSRQRQQYVRVAEQRIVRVAQSMHSLMFTTSTDEQTAVDKMREVQHKLCKCAEEAVKFVDRVRSYRFALCGCSAAGPSVCAPSFSPLSSSSSPSRQCQHHYHHDHRPAAAQQPTLTFIPAPCALHSSHGPPAATTATTPNTIPAQLFMLSKNALECSKLREMVSSLSDQLNGQASTP